MPEQFDVVIPWGKAAKLQATPPPVAQAPPPVVRAPQAPPPASTTDAGFWGEARIGAQHGVAQAVRGVGALSGLLDRFATKLQEYTGAQKGGLFGEAQKALVDIAKKADVTEQDLADPVTTWGKLGRLAGFTGVTVPKYVVASMLMPTSTAAFALVGAVDGAEKAMESDSTLGATVGVAKEALIGAAVGKAQELAAPLKIAPRVLAGAGIGAAEQVARGGSMQDVATGAAANAVFSALPTGAKAKSVDEHVNAPPMPKPHFGQGEIPTDGLPYKSLIETKPHGEVHGKPTLSAWSWLKSPSAWTQNLESVVSQPARRTVNLAVEAHNAIKASTESDLRSVNNIVRKLPMADRERLIQYLNDPNIDIMNVRHVPGITKNMLDAYGTARTVLENARTRIVNVQREFGDPTPDDWGIVAGYFPRVFKGQWKILDKATMKPVEDRVLGDISWRAPSKKEAVKIGEEWAKRTGGQYRVEYDSFQMGPNAKTGAGKKFFSHAQKRSDQLTGYKMDWDTFEDYVAGSHRYEKLSRVKHHLAEVQGLIDTKYDPDSFASKMWSAYSDSVLGKPANWVKGINDMAIRRGLNPDLVQRLTSKVTSFQAVMKLGMSPVSAIANLGQMSNTFAVLGGKYLTRGIEGVSRNAKTGEWDWLLDALHVNDPWVKAEMGLAQHIDDMYRGSLSQAPRAAWELYKTAGLWMFGKAEYMNRASAAVGAYLKAIDSGVPTDRAVGMARDVVTRTQFNLNPADTPRLLANPLGKLALQFQSFTLKQLEFLFGSRGMFRLDGTKIAGQTDGRAKEIARYLTAVAAMGGVQAMPMMKVANAVIRFATGTVGQDIDPLGELDGFLTDMGAAGLSRGIPGALGYDISGNVEVLDPTASNVRVFGPTVTDATNAVAIARADAGADREDAVGKFIRGLSPVARRIMDASGGDMMTDSKGRPTVPVNDVQRWMAYGGITSLPVTQERERYFKDIEHQKQQSSMKTWYARRIADAIQAGDQAEANRLIGEVGEKNLGNLSKAIKSELMTRTQPRLDRYERQHRRDLPPEVRK